MFYMSSLDFECYSMSDHVAEHRKQQKGYIYLFSNYLVFSFSIFQAGLMNRANIS